MTRYSNFASLLLAASLAACAPTSESDELTSVEQSIVLPDAGVVNPGDVLSAPADGSFVFHSMTGTYCRDGSQAGVSVRKSTTNSTRVMVYLQGGGACFDTQTCAANAGSLTDTHQGPAKTGIFDTDNTSNPFKDYNIVYVPYCTGDFHLGNKTTSIPAGPGNQKFFGRANLLQILKSAKKTFPSASKVVLIGSSAGGGGATGNVLPVKNAFGVSNLWLIDDAGPLLSSGTNFGNDYMPGNQQLKWSSYWGWDQTVLADCGAACAGTNNFLPLIAKNAPTVIGRKAAFTGGKQDLNIAALYSQARIDQYGPAGAFGLDVRNALNDYRTRMGSSWVTYYVVTPDNDAQKHMRLPDPDFYYTWQNQVGTNTPVFLSDWITSYLSDNPAVLNSLPNVGN